MPSLMKGLLPLAVAGALAGCGGTTIDGGALEDEIVEDAEREGLVLDGAECPSPDAQEGDTFECTVIVKGEERPLEVVQRNDEGNVQYDLGALLDSSAGDDAGGDETAVRFVIEAVNRDATALCDYATRHYRRALSRRAGQSCAEAVLAQDRGPIDDYEVAVDGDTAAVAGTDSRGPRTVTLERQRNGSWLITRVE